MEKLDKQLEERTQSSLVHGLGNSGEVDLVSDPVGAFNASRRGNSYLRQYTEHVGASFAGLEPDTTQKKFRSRRGSTPGIADCSDAELLQHFPPPQAVK